MLPHSGRQDVLDLSPYNTVVILRETFSMFITAAKYR
jgi:hypothetical protein